MRIGEAAVALAAVCVIAAVGIAAPGAAQTTSPDQGQGADPAAPGQPDSGTAAPSQGHRHHSGQHTHHRRKADPDDGKPADDGTASSTDAPPKT